ncbi:MAG: helix-turn-helix transcriptional regulator [Lachnospiraceae bacterium]|nr:helix-turn-helix transcriptional regulator [Lachnospiraceae bacterium]
MILGDKITELRKREGWSQEQLAEKLGVSRQSVSKWESAQSVPDMNRVLLLSKLFQVSTDYLLDDQLEQLPGSDLPAKEDSYNENGDVLTPVSMETANAFLSFKKTAAPKIALGVAFCIVGSIPMLFLGGMAESKLYNISENAAAAIGVSVLLLLVAAGVAIFITEGIREKKFEYLTSDPLDTAYGISGLVRELREEHSSSHIRSMVIGVTLCVLASVPIVITSIMHEENTLALSIAVSVLLLLVGIGVYLIVQDCIIEGSFDVLLEEGDYTRTNKKVDRRISGIYWSLATAIYLLISFLTGDWHITWVVWPVAGVTYAAVLQIAKNRISR